MSESTVPSINMGALLGTAESNPEPKTALEHALATVDADDASATTMEEVKFQFRDLLDKQQLADLKSNAPSVAQKMIGDYNAIIQFGDPVLTKLNNSSIELLEAQRGIKVPEADVIVNDLLREIDGYSAKFRNEKVEGAIEKLKKFFKGTTYSLKAMVRESQPIIDKLGMAEKQLREMEIRLQDNVSRGQKLHKTTTKTLEEVVGVLAALEEILEVSKKEFNEIDTKVREAEALENKNSPIGTLEYKGKTIS